MTTKTELLPGRTVRWLSPATTSTSIGGSSVRVAAMTVFPVTWAGVELLAATWFFFGAGAGTLFPATGFVVAGTGATFFGVDTGVEFSTSAAWSEPNQKSWFFTKAI